MIVAGDTFAMWPPGHLAVGYIAYSLGRRVYTGHSPSSVATVVLAFATQLPDLADKPLSWTLGVLPTGRSLSHSVFTATILTAVVYWLAHRSDRPALVSAFAIGYWSHLLGDLYAAVIAGEAESNWFWLWPLVPQEGYATRPSLRMYAESVGLYGVALLVYLGLFGLVAGVVWARNDTGDAAFVAFVVVVIASSAVFVLVWSLGSPALVFELALVQVAVALWIWDGVPGLPHPRL